MIGAGIMGAGWSSMFATGLLWLGQRIKVTNRIGAVFTISASAGCDVMPILVGQFIASQPHVLLYLQLGGLVIRSLTFGLAVIVRSKLPLLDQKKTHQ